MSMKMSLSRKTTKKRPKRRKKKHWQDAKSTTLEPWSRVEWIFHHLSPHISSPKKAKLRPSKGKQESPVGLPKVRSSSSPFKKKKGIKTKIYLLQFDFEMYSSFFLAKKYSRCRLCWDVQCLRLSNTAYIYREFNRNHRAKIIKKSVSGRANGSLVWWDTLSKTHVGTYGKYDAVSICRTCYSCITFRLTRVACLNKNIILYSCGWQIISPNQSTGLWL